MLNKVFLIGNLTRDPECRETDRGTKMAKFGLAINHKYRSSTGDLVDEVNFFEIATFAQSADFCGNYLKKGSRIAVEGRLKFSRWEGEGGKSRSKVEVIAQRVVSMQNRTDHRESEENLGEIPF